MGAVFVTCPSSTGGVKILDEERTLFAIEHLVDHSNTGFEFSIRMSFFSVQHDAIRFLPVPLPIILVNK